MGRPSKLTEERQAEIVKWLTAGATIKATCDAVGMSFTTFNNWENRGKAETLRREGSGIKEHSKQWDQEQLFVEFLEAVTHAQAWGLVVAAANFRAGMNPSQTETEATDTTTETRLRQIKRPDGTIEQVPYEHTKTVRKSSITTTPGDWRCAKDYLSRRDPKNWAETRKEQLTGRDGEPLVDFVALLEILRSRDS